MPKSIPKSIPKSNPKSLVMFSLNRISSLSQSSQKVYISSTTSQPIPTSNSQQKVKQNKPKQSSATSANQQSNSGVSSPVNRQPSMSVPESTPLSHLPFLPANLTTLKQLQYRPNTSLNGPRALQNNLSPEQEAQLNLAHYTATDLSCYIAPPLGTIVDMNKVLK